MRHYDGALPLRFPWYAIILASLRLPEDIQQKETKRLSFGFPHGGKGMRDWIQK
jgi:hypothetical protein